MDNNKLSCGHTTNSDLDIFCTKCNRMFIPTFIPYLISGIFLVLIFFSKELIDFAHFNFVLTRPFLLLGLIISYLLFLIISVLRNRVVEMLFSIFTILPFLIIYIITKPISEIPITQNIDFILSISLLIQFFSFVFTLIYGLIDAPKYSKINELHSGSFWIMLAFVMSTVLTLFELELKFLSSIIPGTNFKVFLDNMLYWVEYITKYRAYLVAIVSALVIIISTIKTIKSNLDIKRVDLYKGKINENDSVFIIFGKNIKKLILNIISVIATVSKVTVYILSFIGYEIFKILKDLIIRTLLLLLRIIRFIGIVFFTIVSYYYAVDFAINTDILWSSSSFIEPQSTVWISLLISTSILVLSSWAILMFSYRKWKLFEPENVTLRHSFALIFGKWNELQKSIKSITFSSMMLPVYISLSFFGAWAVINSILYFVNDNITSIGILFVSLFGLILILGIYMIFVEKAISSVTKSIVDAFKDKNTKKTSH